MAAMAMEVDGKQESREFSNYLPDVVETESVIPDAYVWPEQQGAIHTGDEDFDEALEIPVIDLGDGVLREEEICHQIRDACSRWGIFQVVNHGISLRVMERMRSASQNFFALPLEMKEKLECKVDGYLLSGYGFYYGSNKTKTSRRNWSEGLALETPKLGEFSSLLWPDDHDSQLEFCATIEDYNAAMKELASRLFRLLLNSMGVYPNDYEKYAPKEPASLRLNHYPPCPTPSQAVGLLPHKDSLLFTILLQENVSGLQVLNNGRWLPVRPEPEAFTVNVGSMLQVLSNGLYESALHRAVVNKSQNRYSVACFVQPPDWDQISPLPELVDAEHAAQYRPFTMLEFMEVRAAGHPIDPLECFAVQ